MGKLALSDSFESAHDSRAKYYTLRFGESAANSMKSDGAQWAEMGNPGVIEV